MLKARQHLITASLEENKKGPRCFWRFLNVDLSLNEKKSGEIKDDWDKTCFNLRT